MKCEIIGWVPLGRGFKWFSEGQAGNDTEKVDRTKQPTVPHTTEDWDQSHQ